jgi:MFS family permease
LTEPAQRQHGLQVGLLLVATSIAAVTALLSLAPAGTATTVGLVASWMLSGLGVGLAFPILSVQLLKLSPPQDHGRHASALQLADALTTTAALAAAGLLVLQGMGWVMALAAALAATGAVCARRVF